jgi:hypothetical protein
MFVGSRLAFRALKNRKKHTFYSILSIALAVAVAFSTQIITDSVAASLVAREDAHYGNMDYIYYNNTSGMLPLSALPTIAGFANVEHATWRRNALLSAYSDDAPDIPSVNWIMGVPDLPSEREIGNAKVISGINGSNSLEGMLFYPGATRPIVISHELSKTLLLTIGDTVFFIPEDTIALYATPTELQSITNGSLTRLQVETQIIANKSRFFRFTITGIIDDMSEGIESPTLQRSTSLRGFQPPETCYYMNANDMGAYVTNNNTAKCSFFIIATNDFFDAGALKGAVNTAVMGSSVEFSDVKSMTLDVIFYLEILIRAVLAGISIVCILFSSNLIQSNIKRNLDENMRDLGILRASGYPKRIMKTYTYTQTTILSLCGTAIGLAGGLIPPLFADINGMANAILTATQDTEIVIPISISIWSLLIALGVGFIAPACFANRPLREIEKYTIIQMIEPDSIPFDARKVQLSKVRVGIINGLLSISGGFMAFYCAKYFYPTFMSGRFSNPNTILLMIGIGLGLFMLVWCSKTFFSQILAKSVSILLRPFKKAIGRFGRIAHRMALSNTVRVRQLTAFTIMGFAMVSSLVVLVNSVGKNEVYDKRTSVGGDIGIFTVIDSSHVPAIEALPEIEAATVASYVLMSNWESNRVVSPLITNMIDDFGGLRDGVSESVNVMVIDLESFLRTNLNDETLFFIQGGEPEAVVRGLDDGSSVLMELQHVEKCGLSIGSQVTINVMGMQSTVPISATTNFFPGMPLIPKSDNQFSKTRSFIISTRTMQNMVKEFYANVDIMIKNRSVNVS